MTNTWIIAAAPEISALVMAGRGVGGKITVVWAGGDEQQVSGVDEILAINGGVNVPAEALAPAVADAVAAAISPGDVVLAANRPSERALAGAVAAKLGAALLTGVKSVQPGLAVLARYGGITHQSISLSHPVVLVMAGGTRLEPVAAKARSLSAAGSEAVPQGEEGTEVAVDAQTSTVPTVLQVTANPYPASVTGVDTSRATVVDLPGAKRIVAVGRGFKTQSDLQLARDLAATIGAEMACSRPIAEGEGWMQRSRYVGVSGQHVAPQLYIAVGISGQLQHTVGMNDAKVVVAINNDEKAPIFAACDYGIVGDLYSLLPALTTAFANAG